MKLLHKNELLDTVILICCQYYGVEVTELQRKGKSIQPAALAKKAISYFNPIYSQAHYKILMQRIGYAEKTQARHTRNRKEVIRRMRHNESYKAEIKEMARRIEAGFADKIMVNLSGIKEVLENIELPIAFKINANSNMCSNDMVQLGDIIGITCKIGGKSLYSTIKHVNR